MRDPATTGSIGRVASTPLNPPSAPVMASVRSQPLPPPQSAVALRNTAPLAAGGNASGWSAQGGTPIVVAQGETLDMISSRYGVPRAALISANGLSSPTIAPGSRLTIPVYNANAGSVPAARQQFAQSAQVQSDARPEPARTLAPPTAAPTAPAARIAAPAMPASATARAKAVAEAKASAAAESRATEAAQAKTKAATDAQAMRESRAKFAAEAKAKAEARKTTVAAAPVANVPVAKPVVAEVKKPAAEKAKPVVVASAPAAEPKVTAVPKAAPEPVVTASLPKPAAEADASDKADFRWPARGRVISGYSGKGGNEGINIAVPEGTPVKAAEGGTVAYAGSELKGYGNLVLIRHPNGYVSAYAHNGDLKVKRGDTVKRGQVVANSGQSGNVSSPQLHFELRKGSSPVDPTPYLNN
ncbi:peptidoglycan DD-metalloendopeptidase family protein [Bosea sp. 685]|uniref:peptidoglycan DD-metalloendopeptidase family protein n=1 Tax=Bosea sp. 685 TaxID=3080057 RepID=UPI002893508C|nr:peptidoglycan DD-metalloendopeptidase family protein [Bosea sp. 685]WNJ92911.1 peptidoglycan DD-metalloendopeptidase family protein [Bosea sp. 685]